MYATFPTPMERSALQCRINSAQHFWTRRAARRKGRSWVADGEFSGFVSRVDISFGHGAIWRWYR